MKTMTCKELGGACDKKFRANTFDEIAKLSQEHAKEMFAKNDTAHLDAAEKMMKFTSKEMNEWFENKKNEFNAQPEDSSL